MMGLILALISASGFVAPGAFGLDHTTGNAIGIAGLFLAFMVWRMAKKLIMGAIIVGAIILSQNSGALSAVTSAVTSAVNLPALKDLAANVLRLFQAAAGTAIAFAAMLLFVPHAEARDVIPVASLVENAMRAAGIGQPTAAPFDAGATYQVCFTPGGDCEGLIVAEINHAQKQILLQAYSFTSKAIAQALIDSKKRGVAVFAVLDKSQRTERYSGATFLVDAGIPVVIDEQPEIAHNKVLIIDNTDVVTGSFNFTTAAQRRNAENVFIIHNDTRLAAAYAQNWKSRQQQSVPFRR